MIFYLQRSHWEAQKQVLFTLELFGIYVHHQLRTNTAKLRFRLPSTCASPCASAWRMRIRTSGRRLRCPWPSCTTSIRSWSRNRDSLTPSRIYSVTPTRWWELEITWVLLEPFNFVAHCDHLKGLTTTYDWIPVISNCPTGFSAVKAIEATNALINVLIQAPKFL